MSIWENKGIYSFKDLPELRRLAFVECIVQKSEEDNIVGIFGNATNESLIHGYGLYPVPIQGLDGYVFKYGQYCGCDLIKSTVIYMKTEKCPLLFSAKMIITDDFCSKFNDTMLKESRKPVHIYKNDDDLQNILESVYKRTFSISKYEKAKALHEKIDSIIEKLYLSDLSGKELFELEFFSKYIINLEDRVEFLNEALNRASFNDLGERKNIPVFCAGGIYNEIECYLFNSRYKFVFDMENSKFSCRGCHNKKMIECNYVGG